MLYLIIYLTGLFFWDGLALEETSTLKEKNRQEITTEQSILQELYSLGIKAENITQDIEHMVESLKKKFAESGVQQSYKSLKKQMTASRHCNALKNNIEMISTRISYILTKCFELGHSIPLNSLINKADQLKKGIMEEIARWSANSRSQESYNTPLPILRRDTPTVNRESINSVIAVRILLLKKEIERFEMTRRMTELEANLSVKLCSVMEKTYYEEVGSLLTALRECIRLAQPTELGTTKATPTTEASVFDVSTETTLEIPSTKSYEELKKEIKI